MWPPAPKEGTESHGGWRWYRWVRNLRKTKLRCLEILEWNRCLFFGYCISRLRKYVLMCLSCDVHIHVAIHIHIFLFVYIYIRIYIYIHFCNISTNTYLYIYTHLFRIFRERWLFCLHGRYYIFTWYDSICRQLYQWCPCSRHSCGMGCYSPRMKPTPWDLMNQLEESMLWTWAWRIYTHIYIYMNVLLLP